MTNPMAILKRLRKIVPNAELYRRFLVVGNSKDYILRGFIFEKTISKGEYFAWAVIMPMYRSFGGVMLSYSSRLASGDRIMLSDQNTDAVVGQLLSHIYSVKWLERFHSFSNPWNLIRQMTLNSYFTEWNQHWKLVDFAILSFLSGDLDRCAAAARRAAEIPSIYEWQDKFIVDAKYIQAALERDQDELRQWINKMHDESRTSLLYSPNKLPGSE